jgi:hypothetical protein
VLYWHVLVRIENPWALYELNLLFFFLEKKSILIRTPIFMLSSSPQQLQKRNTSDNIGEKIDAGHSPTELLISARKYNRE